MPRLLSRFFLPLVQSGRDLAPVILVIAFFQLVIVQEPVPDLAGKFIGLAFVLAAAFRFTRFGLVTRAGRRHPAQPLGSASTKGGRTTSASRSLPRTSIWTV
jgi:hypothetical protein